MIVRGACAFLFAAGLAGCASSANVRERGALAGEVIQPGCRQGQCSWLRLTSVGPVETRSDGELRRIVARRGTSMHRDGRAFPTAAAGVKIIWEEEDRAEYAFCSSRRPAYAFAPEDGGLVIHFFDPFNLSGYQMASAKVYMRVCHGLHRVPDPKALRALGYRPGTRSEQIEAEGPDAMIAS